MPVRVGNSYVTEAALAFAQKSAAESVDKEKTKGKGTSGVLAELAEKFPKLKFTVGTRPFSGSGMGNVAISPKILREMEKDPAKREEYEALLYDMLRHLAIAVNSIHLTLDCDVILGGFFSEYLRPYLPILRQYVLSGNAFMEDADFVKLSILPRHITPLGAALFFIREFVNSV